MAAEVDRSPSTRTSVPARLRAIAVALVTVAVALFLGTVFTIAVFVLLLSLGLVLDTTTSVFVVAALLPSQLAFAGVGLLAMLALLGSVSVRTPTRGDLVWVALGLGGSFAAVAVLVIISTVVDLGPLQSAVGEAATVDPELLVALAVLSILVIAPAEEFLFRGAIQGRLRKNFGPFGAIGIASAIFASLHVFNFIGGGIVVLVPVAVLFLVGVVLGYVYERTGNLVVPIAVHALYNATLFLSAFVTV
ncbi:CPBP family intramembrane metalloprotease [Haloferax mediterranei ATCC 33500]|uniref:CPBP family intramembrane metalloprotease n=1 Tax=Haloferax mediterranei (strain ATCC 33500 / DSM 1411 / JCM 8866 / NBRC 14739 / NCIMB 2177 / R-4) TaxID=523841 RepID=I3R2P4_HALMT|nr:CPBP family intramembrane glutamic endopeptidase [Haloferax mediterranei]AFK18504.1 hypothetical protein HFX_0781 [Haloferax mediterranei ATCC 33500]AHZ22116.1 hypothetical protein BM92_05335 [Haloferax mediterranei ATCC 33500]EMA02223.1 hypothetical protein C439_06570 [Haloferax mediterranei ATCC 33500]MDX5988592.1 CPBP family intramembrane glutamic endopeptidase [Haloferax mediterranei ATCC 33500]QCQ75008.1 CPBP family intramembrane metalloprotease [Haloferax mediterranei ATCC 33500]